jgi:hypothetical protein
MAKQVRWTGRPTAKFSEIADCDMLTATEKLINNEIGGFYSIGDEQAFFKLSGERDQLTVSQFEAKLQRELHPNFVCIFNSTITPRHISMGHQIGFFIPELNKFVPLTAVGHSGDNILKANSEGSLVKYLGRKSLREKEQAIMSRGWVAGYEFAKLFILDVRSTGFISPAKMMDAQQFLFLKAKSKTLGGKAYNSKLFQEAKKLRMQEIERQELELKQLAEESRKLRMEKLKEMTGIEEDISTEGYKSLISEAKIEVQHEFA